MSREIPDDVRAQVLYEAKQEEKARRKAAAERRKTLGSQPSGSLEEGVRTRAKTQRKAAKKGGPNIKQVFVIRHHPTSDVAIDKLVRPPPENIGGEQGPSGAVSHDSPSASPPHSVGSPQSVPSGEMPKKQPSRLASVVVAPEGQRGNSPEMATSPAEAVQKPAPSGSTRELLPLGRDSEGKRPEKIILNVPSSVRPEKLREGLLSQSQSLSPAPTGPTKTPTPPPAAESQTTLPAAPTIPPEFLQLIQDLRGEVAELRAQKQAPTASRILKPKSPPSWSSTEESGDIVLWLEKIGNYLKADPGMSEDEKVHMASGYLEGKAQEYWMNIRLSLSGEGQEDVTMAIFREVLMQQYAECFRQENAADDLCNLRETRGLFIKYKEQFDELVSKLPADPAAFKECVLVALFRKGLHSTTGKRCIVDSTGARHTSLRELQRGAQLAAKLQARVDEEEREKKAVLAPLLPLEPKRKNFPLGHQPSQPGPKRRPKQCNFCGKKGHVQAECRSAQRAPRDLPGPPAGKPPPGASRPGNERPRH
jgi:hypothetical protein